MTPAQVHSPMYVADPTLPRYLLPCCSKLVNEDGWRAFGLGDPPTLSGRNGPSYRTGWYRP